MTDESPDSGTGLRGPVIAAAAVTALLWTVPVFPGLPFRPVHLVALLVPVALLWALDRVAPPVTPRDPEPAGRWLPGALLLLYLATAAAGRIWFFFPGWHLPGAGGSDWGDSWLLRTIGVAVGFHLLLRRRPDLPGARMIWLLWGVAVGGCLWALYRETGFAPLYRVDHPSFYYRYQTFLEGFPHPGFYDPHWNAGQPVPYLVASGTWSLALIWLPLLAVVPLDLLFTPMLAVTFLVLTPLSGALAARLFGGSSRAAGITAVLYLVPGLRFFTHVLNYGTAPSIFCLCLAPLVLAGLWRLLHAEGRRELGLWSVVLTGVSALVLCWPGSLLLGVPLAAGALPLIRRFTPRRLLWLGICAGALVVALAPLAAVPMRYSSLGTFLGTDAGHESMRDMLVGGVRRLGDLLQGMHPLILVGGFAGVCFDPRPDRRRCLGAFMLAGVLAGGWGEEFSPLLQWERLLIPAGLVGAVVCGGLLDRLLELRPGGGFRQRAAAAWVLAVLVMGAYLGTRLYGNRGPMKFQTMPEETRNLAGWLEAEVPEGTRVLIAGRAVHGFGGAKVAALPLWTGREMISCDYYGFSPKLVEYQCPPRHVLRHGPGAVREYLDLQNVSMVMTFHDNWKAALDRHPDWYIPRAEFGKVKVYEVRGGSSPIRDGTGLVQAEINRLRVELDTADGPVVLKYNWAAGWTAPPPVDVYPVTLPYDLTFIGVDPHGETSFTLEFSP